MLILETKRLKLLEFEKSDAKFILELLNEPAWIEFIGEKNVHTLIDAENFIINNLNPSYSNNGYGLYAIKLKEDNTSIGMCGLVNRPGLSDIDLGFACLSKYQRHGYAYESSIATLNYAKNVLKIDKVVAITNPNNTASGKLLDKLGFRFDKLIDLSEEGKDICKLYTPQLNS